MGGIVHGKARILSSVLDGSALPAAPAVVLQSEGLMEMIRSLRYLPSAVLAANLCVLILPGAGAASQRAPEAAGPTAYVLSIAEAASTDPALAEFYRARGYRPLWTGDGAADAQRRAAILAAVADAPLHGLPAARYDPAALRAMLEGAGTPHLRARAEVSLSALLLSYASDIGTGILVPASVDSGIRRQVETRDPLKILASIQGPHPALYLRSLQPSSQRYTRLVHEKARLHSALEAGGWGAAIPSGRLKPGQDGAGVVALRDRLIRMGYLRPTAAGTYDGPMAEAVAAAQRDFGLAPDGIAGPALIAALNVGIADRLGQILVAMERERWMPRDTGRRHVWVNLPEFKSRLIEDGETVFETRAVIGKDTGDRRTPEFSDVMEYMVVNPSWFVPRSIVVNEYLPKLRANPGALGHMRITDRNGREVSRARGFSQYTARTFPYSMRQPPSSRNALGLVKFIFPNTYNIYLHDTPAKDLFSRDMRAFSHGCIRLAEPFDFAHALLEAQREDGAAYFQRILNSGSETRVPLDTPLPVHLVYFTAIPKPRGGMEWRPDVYGRDSAVLAALRRAGVVLPADPG